jgi:hypothetical protein
MLEREKLEREVHQLRQIIKADAYALASKSTPIVDRARLQKQIAIRTTMWAGLSKELISGVSSLGAAEPRGPRAQAKAYPRSEAHEGRVATNRSALLARIQEIRQAQAKSKSKLGAHRP